MIRWAARGATPTALLATGRRVVLQADLRARSAKSHRISQRCDLRGEPCATRVSDDQSWTPTPGRTPNGSLQPILWLFRHGPSIGPQRVRVCAKLANYAPGYRSGRVTRASLLLVQRRQALPAASLLTTPSRLLRWPTSSLASPRTMGLMAKPVMLGEQSLTV